jgi:hypothetical protein
MNEDSTQGGAGLRVGQAVHSVGEISLQVAPLTLSAGEVPIKASRLCGVFKLRIGANGRK